MKNFKLRFIPLGGIVDVTKNMYLYELYENGHLDDILIIDCGIGFPAEKELGVDFVIPDIGYLKDKAAKIKGIIFTHGHEDHTSALPYHYQVLGSPSVFATRLTSVLVKNKFKEFKLPIKLNQVDYQKEYLLGNFRVNFIRVTHSIPDTVHLLIKTPVGTIYHGPDFKLDLTPPYGVPPDFYSIVKAGREGVLCLLSDCLGAEREGLTLSENAIGQTFEDEMRKTKGKFLMTSFSSNISRIRQCVETAIKFNRKIIFLGRSMKENTRLASEIGYLPIPPNFKLREEEAKKLPPNKLCLIVAGSQGQYDSALSKLANDQNPHIKIGVGDKIVFSSDPIPGNENEVYALIEALTRKGADVVYTDIAEELHASGHGSREDLKFLIRFTDPAYFIPIGGTVRHQRQYQKIVEELGYPKDRVFMLQEGETVWFLKNKAYRGETVETKNIYVDAYGVGDVGNIILRDRKTLSSEGMVVIFLIIDKFGRLVTSPKILSRGFIFEKGNEDLFKQAAGMVEKVTKPKGGKALDLKIIKRELVSLLEEFFLRKTGRRPLVVMETAQV